LHFLKCRQKSFVMPDTEGILAELLEIRDRVNALITKASGDSEKSARTPPPAIAERMAANLCIRCGKMPAATRGLCNPDYQGVRRMIRKLRISDSEAVARWLWLDEGPKGRKSKYAIDDDLPKHEAAREGAEKVNKKLRKKKP
jgi:hypothetical protein